MVRDFTYAAEVPNEHLALPTAPAQPQAIFGKITIG